MIICPKCDHRFAESDQKCTKCHGTKFIETPVYEKMTVALKAAGVTTRRQIGTKSTICTRCNGAGTELAAKNRNNRKRGGSNEYKAVDIFTDWWLAPDGSKYEWRRTPQSGGSTLAEGFDMAGDICTTAPDWPFHIECKRTEGWEFSQLINRTTCIYGDMLKFVTQTIDDAPLSRIPTLWLMHPGPSQPTYIMLMTPAGKPTLVSGLNIWTGHMHVDDPKHPLIWQYYIMGLDKFLSFGAAEWRTIIKEHHERANSTTPV